MNEIVPPQVSVTAQGNKKPEEYVGQVVDPEQKHSGSLLDAVMQAASNPSTDIDKMERLLAMAERLQARDAEREFGVAMSEAQEEMRPVARDADNTQTRSKYATYAALDKAVRPIYTHHGFSLSFDTGDIEGEAVRVLCYVTHRAGHKRTYHVDVPAETKGMRGGDMMTRTHAVGSAMTYGQRYLLRMIFNMTIGTDDDGNAAGRYEWKKPDKPAKPAASTPEPPAPQPEERIPPPWDSSGIDWPIVLPDTGLVYTTCPSVTAFVGEMKEIIDRVRESKKRSEADKQSYLTGLRDANKASLDQLKPEDRKTLKFTDEDKEP